MDSPSANVCAVTTCRLNRITIMSKPKLEFRKTNIIVSGRTPFPLDMLRYDACKPTSSGDVAMIEDSLKDDIRTTRAICLTRFSGDGGRATAARWRSFGWEVIVDDGSV